MKHKYLAFDLETTKPLPEDHDWKTHRPMGIACAATLLADTDELVLWQSASKQMNQQQSRQLARYLTSKVEQGYTIVTWNGLGFDFDILAEESGLLSMCRSLAFRHVDMMFHILCKLGYGVSLDAAAKGMGLAGKTMNGADAPKLWAEGKRHEVLEYVAQDARTTIEVATACEALGKFRWIAKSGNLRTMRLPCGWLTVDEADKLPMPNTSWMSDPWPREKFTDWMR